MTLYRGRVDVDYGDLMNQINRSLPVDIRLLPYDLLVNRAWAVELRRLAVLSNAELDACLEALSELAAQHQRGRFGDLPDDEDVHTLIERLLTERVGAAGAKIHTGRSRNDQVATDIRLFASDRLAELAREIVSLIGLLRERAEKNAEVLFAGTTHAQPAQPISLGFYLLSLAQALMRDHTRLLDARDRTNLCPLGAGALAGSAFAVDRQALADALGFDGVLDNALDAVSDRDFAQEIAAACAVLTNHLSRYAEQFIWWANPAFDYLRFADEWSTGSSMMPQKRNPDAMELVRAKAARCLSDSVGLLALTKNLPPSYSKDLQEDKYYLFDALDTARLALRVFHQALATASFNVDRLQRSLTAELLATEIADALTRTGVPFRTAHERVGALVQRLETANRSLADVSDAEWHAAFPELPDASLARDYDAAANRRKVIGGTAPAETRRQCARLGQWINQSPAPAVRVPE